MTMKIILMRDVKTFCVVDICHCVRINQLTLSSGISEANYSIRFEAEGSSGI